MHPTLELSRNNHKGTDPAAARILLAEDDDVAHAPRVGARFKRRAEATVGAPRLGLP